MCHQCTDVAEKVRSELLHLFASAHFGLDFHHHLLVLYQVYYVLIVLHQGVCDRLVLLQACFQHLLQKIAKNFLVVVTPVRTYNTDILESQFADWFYFGLMERVLP